MSTYAYMPRKVVYVSPFMGKIEVLKFMVAYQLFVFQNDFYVSFTRKRYHVRVIKMDKKGLK